MPACVSVLNCLLVGVLVGVLVDVLCLWIVLSLLSHGCLVVCRLFVSAFMSVDYVGIVSEFVCCAYALTYCFLYSFVSFFYVLDVVIAHAVIRVLLRIGVRVDVHVGVHVDVHVGVHVGVCAQEFVFMQVSVMR